MRDHLVPGPDDLRWLCRDARDMAPDPQVMAPAGYDDPLDELLLQIRVELDTGGSYPLGSEDDTIEICRIGHHLAPGRPLSRFSMYRILFSLDLDILGSSDRCLYADLCCSQLI